MDTRYLRFFIQTGKSGSLVEAARRLHITQQGLSAAIIRMEAELRCQLFVRTRKGVTLTPEGAFLMPRAERIIALLEECEQRFAVAVERKPFRLVCNFGILGILRDGVLERFEQQRPDLRLAATERPGRECETALRRGEADVGLLTGLLDPEEFDAQPLFAHDIVVIAPADHPLAGAGQVSVEQLRDAPIVSLDPRFRMYHLFAELCREAGFAPNIVQYAGEITTVHKLVGKGIGLAVTVDFILRDIPSARVAAIPLRPAQLWEVHVVVTRGKEPAPGVADFVRHMTEAYGAPASLLSEVAQSSPPAPAPPPGAAPPPAAPVPRTTPAPPARAARRR